MGQKKPGLKCPNLERKQYMKKYEFILKDLDCANCANKIQEKLEQNPKLHNVNVNFAKLKLTYETDTVSVEEVRKAVKEQEPDVEMISAEKMKEIAPLLEDI